MNGLMKASVSTGSTHRAARVTCNPHVSVPSGAAAAGPARAAEQQDEDGRDGETTRQMSHEPSGRRLGVGVTGRRCGSGAARSESRSIVGISRLSASSTPLASSL